MPDEPEVLFFSSLSYFHLTYLMLYLCIRCPFSATPHLQSDIAALYIKVGVKNIGTVFLHTDAQIPDERFLVLINDMLASGLATLT